MLFSHKLTRTCQYFFFDLQYLLSFAAEQDLQSLRVSWTCLRAFSTPSPRLCVTCLTFSYFHCFMNVCQSITGHSGLAPFKLFILVEAWERGGGPLQHTANLTGSLTLLLVPVFSVMDQWELPCWDVSHAGVCGYTCGKQLLPVSHVCWHWGLQRGHQDHLWQEPYPRGSEVGFAANTLENNETMEQLKIGIQVSDYSDSW